MRNRSLVVSILLFSTPFSAGFAGFFRDASCARGKGVKISMSEQDIALDQDETVAMNPEVCEQFTILTCSATSCAQKRKVLGMDQYATFGAFYGRIKDGNAPDVQIEESTCLGSCKKAPCVAIQHEDYVGNVGLEGMTEMELKERVFHKVITEDDADRVWSCVENAIKQMAEEDEEEH